MFLDITLGAIGTIDSCKKRVKKSHATVPLTKKNTPTHQADEGKLLSVQKK